MAGALPQLPPDLGDDYSQDMASASQASPSALESAMTPSANARKMQQQGEQLITEDPAGALSQASANKDAMRQAQIKKINDAMGILQAANARVNLPMVAIGSALLSPTRTGSFGESIGNAGTASIPAFQQQRKNEMDVANLGIKSAEVASEGAKEGYQDFLTRFGLGRQLESGAEAENLRRILANSAIQRANIAAQGGVDRANIGAAARIGAANIGAGARTDAAGIAAQGGVDRANIGAGARTDSAAIAAAAKLATDKPMVAVTRGPTIQMFDRRDGTMHDTGEPTTDAQRLEWQQNHGDRQLEILQQNADTARKRAEQQSAIYLGTSPDDPKVGLYMDRKSGDVTNGPAVAGKAGAADTAHIRESHSLMKEQGVDFPTAYGMVRSGVNDSSTFQRLVQAEKKIIQSSSLVPIPDKQAEAQARETVVNREKGRAAQKPAAAPAPAAAPTNPAPAAAAVPAKPAGVPAGAQYSPGTKAWWWQEGGAWKTSPAQ